MAADRDTVQTLRGLYVHQNLSLAAAARRLDLSERTAQRWKARAAAEGDDWDMARAASLMAGEGVETAARVVLEQFLKLHSATIQALEKDAEIGPLEKAEALSRLADAYTKTLNAIGRSTPKLSKLAIANDVLRRLSHFIQERHPQRLSDFLEVLEPFAAELGKLYG